MLWETPPGKNGCLSSHARWPGQIADAGYRRDQVSQFGPGASQFVPALRAAQALGRGFEQISQIAARPLGPDFQFVANDFNSQPGTRVYS